MIFAHMFYSKFMFVDLTEFLLACLGIHIIKGFLVVRIVDCVTTFSHMIFQMKFIYITRNVLDYLVIIYIFFNRVAQMTSIIINTIFIFSVGYRKYFFDEIYNEFSRFGIYELIKT